MIIDIASRQAMLRGDKNKGVNYRYDILLQSLLWVMGTIKDSI
jgi:hypothetical protein